MNIQELFKLTKKKEKRFFFCSFSTRRRVCTTASRKEREKNTKRGKMPPALSFIAKYQDN